MLVWARINVAGSVFGSHTESLFRKRPSHGGESHWHWTPLSPADAKVKSEAKMGRMISQRILTVCLHGTVYVICLCLGDSQ